MIRADRNHPPRLRARGRTRAQPVGCAQCAASSHPAAAARVSRATGGRPPQRARARHSAWTEPRSARVRAPRARQRPHFTCDRASPTRARPQPLSARPRRSSHSARSRGPTHRSGAHSLPPRRPHVNVATRARRAWYELHAWSTSESEAAPGWSPLYQLAARRRGRPAAPAGFPIGRVEGLREQPWSASRPPLGRCRCISRLHPCGEKADVARPDPSVSGAGDNRGDSGLRGASDLAEICAPQRPIAEPCRA